MVEVCVVSWSVHHPPPLSFIHQIYFIRSCSPFSLNIEELSSYLTLITYTVQKMHQDFIKVPKDLCHAVWTFITSTPFGHGSEQYAYRDIFHIHSHY
jgi:hypothetical protein